MSLTMISAEKVEILKGHTSDVTGCDFFGDYLATCAADKSVHVWFQKQFGKFNEMKYSPLVGHSYGVNCVRFSPLGTLLASCSTDGCVILWSIHDGEKIGEMQHLQGSPIRVCSFSPTSAMFATGGDDEKVVLWDITTKTSIRVLEGHESMITALAFTADSAFLLSCSTAGDIMLWDARYGHGKCLYSVTNAHDLGVTCCDFSSQYEAVAENGFLSGNYSLATAGNDDFVKVWSVETSSIKNISLMVTLEAHSGNVMSCRFSPDGSILASTGGDRLVILWNPKTGKMIQKLEGHSRYVTCCAFSNNMLLASGSNDKTVVVWILDRQKMLDTLNETTCSSQSCIGTDFKRTFLSWTVNDVTKWLESLNLDEYVQVFLSNSINGKELMYLNHENLLTALKIGSLGHRNKILRGIQCLKNPLWQYVLSENEDDLVLSEFLCPITHEIMRNPVVSADGYSYEKQAIKEWFESGKNTSPMTNEVLEHNNLIPNRILMQLIEKYKT